MIRVKYVRHTAYSLMNARFHGTSGVGNSCLKKMLDAYWQILPRMLYGLEALIISPKQKQMLKAFFSQMLKRIVITTKSSQWSSIHPVWYTTGRSTALRAQSHLG